MAKAGTFADFDPRREALSLNLTPQKAEDFSRPIAATAVGGGSKPQRLAG
jgi:hypothetical protein